jgi:hypothetical protein
MDISIARDGAIIDQVDLEEARQKFRAGELREADWYWHTGMTHWRPLPLLFAENAKLPFARPVPEAPNLLDRLLGRKSKSACLALYWDLLAVAPDHGAVAAADLEALDATCGTEVRQRGADTLKTWFEAYVAMVLADGAVTGSEQTLLLRVAAAFGIPAARATSELKAACIRYHASQVELMLKADRPVLEIIEHIRQLEARLGLTEDELAASRGPVFSRHIDFLIGDKESLAAPVAPAAARAIRDYADAFKFNLDNFPGVNERLTKGEARWRAEFGELVEVDAGLMLAKGEVCYWTSDAELLQMKRVTVGLTYGGPSLRIPIMKGLSWRMGSYRGMRHTADQLVSIDHGQVAITNQRIIFNGPLKNLVIKLGRIIDLAGYKDGFTVDQPTGISPTFIIPGDPVVPFRLITRLSREAQE